jgi:two-component system CheB/CheR fusion protein
MSADWGGDAAFQRLLGYLGRTRGFDFAAYKRSTLARRTERRMRAIGMQSYDDYVDRLEVDPDEFEALFNTLLINVTSFFRDAGAWAYLADSLRGRLGAGAPDGGPDGAPLRVWSAGCASGEEAYSIAMLLADRLGPAEYTRRVKIYATDVDLEALAQARQGLYDESQVEAVPPRLREQFLVRQGRRYAIEGELRRAVIFGRHNLVQDSPISRVDLILCRNTLMYFNAEAQARVLGRFEFALNDGGLLFLGRAEMMLGGNPTFAQPDLAQRLFVRLPRTARRRRDAARPLSAGRAGMASRGLGDDLRDAALHSGPVASIVVDVEGTLAIANNTSQLLLGVGAADLGRPLAELPLADAPLDLRGLTERVLADPVPRSMPDVEWYSPTGERRLLAVLALPLVDPAGALLGVNVTFTDVTPFHELQDELKLTRHEMDTTSEELQSANEELETTNEELQSTVEELATTNEELHATNAEKQTLNDALQATNERLVQHAQDIEQLNGFLQAVLASLRHGVVVVDPELRVLAWNAQAEAYWKLTDDEVRGRSFLDLDLGLPARPVAALLQAASRRTDGPAPSDTIPATDRYGADLLLRVTANDLVSPQGERLGIILMLEQRAPTEVDA